MAHKSKVNLTCASSVSYNVTFSWTHNGTSISGSSATGNTSILTITSVRYNQAGRYVCTVSSGSLSVMSNTATLTVYGEICSLLIDLIEDVVQVLQILCNTQWVVTYQKRKT